MSKRSASSSFGEDNVDVKKLKLDVPTGENSSEPASPVEASPRAIATSDIDSHRTETSADPETQVSADDKTLKPRTKQPAGEGFHPWKSGAPVKVPAALPHWGVIPRTGGVRPSKTLEDQLPARKSDAAIFPALWDDRKGDVRLRRGARFMNGYDQAQHMWLPLMDLRPIGGKNQKPKRRAVIFEYLHGMPDDWNDTTSLNDMNKALQGAIKSHAHEAPWSQVERDCLAHICAEHPEKCIWYIAEQFNDIAHPVTPEELEDDQYPKGRSIESIRHEYLVHKLYYEKGYAPTQEDKTNLPIIQCQAVWLADKKVAEAAAKADAKAAKAAAKVAAKKEKAAVKAATKKMSDTNNVKKPKRSPKSKYLKTEEDMATSTDATSQLLEETEAAEIAKTPRALGSAPEANQQPIIPIHTTSEPLVDDIFLKAPIETVSTISEARTEPAPSIEAASPESVSGTTKTVAKSAFRVKAARSILIDEDYDVSDENEGLL